MKKVAVRAMIILAAVVALSLFFSGTIRTLTTPKARFLTPRQGKFEQVTEMTGKVYFADEEDVALDLPEGVSLTLQSVQVQAGDYVKKGDPLFSAAVVDLSRTLTTLQEEYSSAQDTLRTQERKNGTIRLTRNEQAWMDAYYAAAAADEARRDKRADMLALLEEEELALGENDALPEKASDALRAAWTAWKDAAGTAEAAAEDLASLDRYAIADTVWEDMKSRREQQEKMEDAEQQIMELTVLSRMASRYPAPHDGYVTSVSAEKGSALDGTGAVLKMTPEKTVPVLRADITDIKQTVSKGAAVDVVADQWSSYSTRVTATGVNSDNSRYAEIAITEDMISGFGSLRNMVKGDVKLRMTTRAQESSCLIPASAVRGSEGDRYVYVTLRQSSTFGGTQILVQKTPVTVLQESDTIVSVAEDLSYSQVIYQEDRSLSEGDTVMAYESESK